MFRFAIIMLLCGCIPAIESKSLNDPQPVDTAVQFEGFGEKQHRTEIKALIGVDPRRYEWCAAFVNSILELHDIPGSETVSEHPLLARSFLKWGEPVEEPELGDIVVFTRNNSNWKGHVGFYIESAVVDGVPSYIVLGGNQDDMINHKAYPTSRLLGIRRIPIDED
jgi:uncharacterized protein (TIGR02594 family)